MNIKKISMAIPAVNTVVATDIGEEGAASLLLSFVLKKRRNEEGRNESQR
jgi:hypothetical protein